MIFHSSNHLGAFKIHYAPLPGKRVLQERQPLYVLGKHTDAAMYYKRAVYLLWRNRSEAIRSSPIRWSKLRCATARPYMHECSCCSVHAFGAFNQLNAVLLEHSSIAYCAIHYYDVYPQMSTGLCNEFCIMLWSVLRQQQWSHYVGFFCYFCQISPITPYPCSYSTPYETTAQGEQTHHIKYNGEQQCCHICQNVGQRTR